MPSKSDARRAGSGTSFATEVADAIRSDILEGRIPSGERLRLKPLCERFGVSLSVIREALTRLVASRLVVSAPQLGFAVVSIDEAHLRDLTAVRCEVEGVALRWAIQRGGVDWEAGIVSSLHTLERTPVTLPGSAEDPGGSWPQVHRHFHYALASGCGSPLLLDLRDELFTSSELYRMWASVPAADHHRDVHAEHAAIARAALARAEDEAVELLTQHLQTTADLLIRFRAEHAAS
ncbi:GntR family transcriptional regulator [Nonomuraea sp. NPDC050783]|uniref:GntR family transcriptional regulator n=1 Tax=Nonomuraea sp. NPDC050783 TaxID=3154634 RepID=UPI0034673167